MQCSQVLPGQILHAAAEPVTEDEHTTVLLQNGGAVDIRLALSQRHEGSAGTDSVVGISRSRHAEVWYKSQNNSQGMSPRCIVAFACARTHRDARYHSVS